MHSSNQKISVVKSETIFNYCNNSMEDNGYNTNFKSKINSWALERNAFLQINYLDKQMREDIP